jgi:hypothetical protein
MGIFAVNPPSGFIFACSFTRANCVSSVLSHMDSMLSAPKEEIDTLPCPMLTDTPASESCFVAKLAAAWGVFIYETISGTIAGA